MMDVITFEDGSFKKKEDLDEVVIEIIKVFAKNKISYCQFQYLAEEIRKEVLKKCVITDLVL